MFPLLFHYYDVSRQDPLLKPNNNNVMEVPGSSSIRVVPREDGMFHVNLAMEIPRELKERRHSVSGSTGSSIRGQKVVSIHFKKKEVKDGYVSHLARQSTLRGHGMYNFSVRISTVMSLLEDPEIREHSILFYWETEFEFCPELEEHFEIFEQGLFHVTLVTSANTKDETLPPWSGFVQKEA